MTKPTASLRSFATTPKNWETHMTINSIRLLQDIYSTGATEIILDCLSYLLTPSSRVLIERLAGSQLVKKLHAFYGTRRLITAFTSARQLSLPWASSIQSMPPHSTSWRSILTLSSHLRLGLPSGLFPLSIPTKILYTPLLSPIRATRPLNIRLFTPVNL